MVGDAMSMVNGNYMVGDALFLFKSIKTDNFEYHVHNNIR